MNSKNVNLLILLAVIIGLGSIFYVNEYLFSDEVPTTEKEIVVKEIETLIDIPDEEIDNKITEFDQVEKQEELESESDTVVQVYKENVPVTIPLHQGYYMGKAVYYIITDSSNSAYADIISKNQASKVNFASLLENATKDAVSKTYLFTNGVPGDGVHGFQGEIFTSTPIQTDVYSALRSHVQVTWIDASTPIILDSEKAVIDTANKGLVRLSKLDVVLNMPQIVWPGGQMPVKSNKTITDETPFVGGQITDINLTNRTVTFIAHKGWDSQGKTIYYIVTDTTPIGPANSLGVTHVPKNSALISNAAAVDMFHFMNGIKGPGPLGFQAGIASGFPGDENYSPMSRIYFISWNDPESSVILQTKSEIDAFEKSGLIRVDLARPMNAEHIVNNPIIVPIQLELTK
jgi:hypothetical protein